MGTLRKAKLGALCHRTSKTVLYQGTILTLQSRLNRFNYVLEHEKSP